MILTSLGRSLSRQFSTISKISHIARSTSASPAPKKPIEKYPNLTAKQQEFLQELIRVDQAGELGANYIYQGQIFALIHKYPHLKPVLNHMWEQEVHHHNTFNDLQIKHRIRPSLLTPIWRVGAIGMGFVTGSISKEAAMACTVAVETVIGGHYNEQLRALMNDCKVDEVTGETSEEIKELMGIVKEFRDQELEHLDTAIEHDAESAVPYMVITGIIKIICKFSIFTAAKV